RVGTVDRGSLMQVIHPKPGDWVMWLPTVVLLLGLSACVTLKRAVATCDGPYHGMVVDAETRAPIQDAVIVVEWVWAPIISMEGPRGIHSLQESSSDASGSFRISSTRGTSVNPFVTIQE